MSQYRITLADQDGEVQSSGYVICETDEQAMTSAEMLLASRPGGWTALVFDGEREVGGRSKPQG